MPNRVPFRKGPVASAVSEALPAWLSAMLDDAAISPVGMGLKADSTFAGPVIKTLGKTVKETLGSIFTTPKGSGLPARLRFVNYNTRDKLMHLRAEDATRERLDIPLNQFERMMTDGAI